MMETKNYWFFFIKEVVQHTKYHVWSRSNNLQIHNRRIPTNGTYWLPETNIYFLAKIRER